MQWRRITVKDGDRTVAPRFWGLAHVLAFLLLSSLAGPSLLAQVAGVAKEEVILIKGYPAHRSQILAKYRDLGKVRAQSSAVTLNNLGMAASHQFDLVPGLVILDDVAPRVAPQAANAPPRDAKVEARKLTERIEELRKTGLFEYVEPDYLVHLKTTPGDGAFADGTLWGLRNLGQNGGTSGADIGTVQAWDLTTGSAEVIVAVIDSGVRYTHHDLAANMWRNPGEIPGNSIDDDLDGYVDNVFGINAINGTGNPMDDNGHGTHVAGTIGAAANDGNPHVGVAWNVKLMACKFLSGAGSGKLSDAIKCIDFAVSKGARILNNSWGGGPFEQALRDAISRARDRGVLFVAAAGNDGTNNDLEAHYPSNYSLDNIISVAAVDRNNQLASFSNYGLTTVDIGAPGVDIYSCWNGSDSDYKRIQGTSMAAPHVAGVAALVLSRYPGISVGDLRRAILNTTVSLPALQGKVVTGGRLSASAALGATADGNLEVSVLPVSGSALVAGSVVPLSVAVSDFGAVSNANITASISGSTNLVFNNSGTGADAVANDANYGATFSVPPFATTVSVNFSVAAPGKVTTNFTVIYAIVIPPVNNDFEKRTVLFGAVTNATGSSGNANRQSGEPAHAGDPGGRSVWWSWTAPSDGRVEVSTAGSNFDTLLAVYSGAVLGSLNPVASNDDWSGAGGYSLVAFTASAGTTYQIAVDGFAGAGGEIQLTLRLEQVTTAPANNNFSSAQLLTGSSLSASTSSVNGTKESGEPAHAGNAGGASVWFNWTAPLAGLATVRTTGSDFDTLLGVYTGSVVSSLSEVVSNDDDPNGGVSSRVLFAAVAGQTYRIAVDGYNGNSGNISLSLSLESGQSGPVNDLVQNATSISGTSANVSGSNVGATKSFGEPSHADNVGGRSVWWRWTAPGSGITTITTLGSAFDTLLAVYPNDSFNSVVSNDDDPAGGVTSRVRFFAVAGTTYRIAVDGYRSSFGTVATGNISLNLALDTGLRPANDDFVNRVALSGANVMTNGSNVGASIESVYEPLHADNEGGSSVWWSWTPSFSGWVSISTEGSNFDTLMGIYLGNNVTNLSTVISNDDRAGVTGGTSEVVFSVVGGTTYQIAVDGYNGAFGNILLNIELLGQSTVIYSTGFESNQGFTTTQDLAGQGGWQIQGSGGNGIVPNYMEGFGQNAYVGYFPPIGADTATFLWRALNVSPATNDLVLFSVYLDIQDSLNDRWDQFEWVVFNRNNDALFSIYFDNFTLEIGYTLDNGTRQPVRTFSNDQVYHLTMVMDFANNLWTASIGGENIIEPKPITSRNVARDLGDIDAFWFIATPGQPGDNYMLFDNYHVELVKQLFAPAITPQPQSQTVVAGTDVALQSGATGTAPFTYQWYREGEPVPGANGSSLQLNDIEASQAGRYWLVASNSVGSARSQDAIVIVQPAVVIPPNDNFANRIVLTGPSNVVSAATTAATRQSGEPAHAGNAGGKSVWWSWTAPTTQKYTIATLGSDFDTLLGIYTGSSVNALSLVNSNDDAQDRTRGSIFTFNAVAGTTYQIAVDGFNGDGGNVRLTVKPAAALELASPLVNPGSGLSLTFSGEPGVTYEIQASTDLLNWQTLTNRLGPEGVVEFFDSAATNYTRRFYRVRQEE